MDIFFFTAHLCHTPCCHCNHITYLCGTEPRVRSCHFSACGMMKRFLFITELWTEWTVFVLGFLVLCKNWSGISLTRSYWLFIARSGGLACINGQPGGSSLAGFVSLRRDMPSDSLHLCLSLCDSSTLPSVTHTYTLSVSSLATLQPSIFLGIQHRANWVKEILLIINDVNSLVWHLT